MAYSLTILNRVSPTPSTKQSGNAPPRAAAAAAVETTPYTGMRISPFGDRSINPRAASRDRLSRYRAAIQIWVGRLAS